MNKNQEYGGTPPLSEDDVLAMILNFSDGAEVTDPFNPYDLACESKSLRAVHLAKLNGFDINCINDDGTTALTWAPDSEFTKLLVDLGAKVAFESPDDRSLSLHHAAKRGSTEQLEILLTECDGLDFIDYFDEFGKTPLTLAAENGHLETMRLLLKHGANPNAYDDDYLGYTVLQRAIENRQVEAAKLMISSGADINYREGMTELPLEIAKRQGVYNDLSELFDMPTSQRSK